MFYGNTNIFIPLQFNGATILSDERLHMIFVIMAAIGAVGYGDYQCGSGRITLQFSLFQRKLRRKPRLTGSAIEKYVEAQRMLSINVNEALCRLMAFEKAIPDEIGLEILIDADLANHAHTHLLLCLCNGKVTWDKSIDAFMEWLQEAALTCVWRNDPYLSITAMIDLKMIKATSQDAFLPVTVKLPSERKQHPLVCY